MKNGYQCRAAICTQLTTRQLAHTRYIHIANNYACLGHRVAGNLRGEKKLSRISRFCAKVFSAKFWGVAPFAQQKQESVFFTNSRIEVFSLESFPLYGIESWHADIFITNSRKFSPSKVSRLDAFTIEV